MKKACCNEFPQLSSFTSLSAMEHIRIWGVKCRQGLWSCADVIFGVNQMNGSGLGHCQENSAGLPAGLLVGGTVRG